MAVWDIVAVCETLTITNHHALLVGAHLLCLMKMSLDNYVVRPQGMRDYLGHYGWHFNRKAFDFAVSKMRKKQGDTTTKVDPYTKDEVNDILRRAGLTLDNDVMYDAAYVATMCRADYAKSSVPDEAHVALFVKDTLDDCDACDGETMRCWYAKMVGRGEPVEWEDFL